MKIFPISTVQQPATLKPGQTTVSRNGYNYDSFSRGAKSPAFKQKQGNIYKYIWENPDLKNKFLEFIVGAGAIFVTKMSLDNNIPEASSDKKESKDIINSLKELLGGIFAPQNEAEKVQDNSSTKEPDVKEDITLQTESENSNSTDTEVKNAGNDEASEIPVTEKDEKPKEELKTAELVKVDYPTKKGRLSKKQEELKKIVLDMEFSPEAAEQLQFICKILMNGKEIFTKDGEKKNQSSVIEDLLQCLQSAKELAEKEKEIGTLYNELNTEEEKKPLSEDKNSITDNSNNSEPQSSNIQTDNPQNEPKYIESLNGKKIKVLGQLDLPEQNAKHSRIKKRNVKLVSSSTAPSAPDGFIRQANIRYTTVKNISKNEDFKKYIFACKDQKTHSLSENLDKILFKFEKSFIEDKKKLMGYVDSYVYFSTGMPMPKNITIKNVEDELIYNKDKHNKDKITLKYEHINDSNIKDVADAINSDDRFADLFTVHSALRFIDRFVDFNNGTPITRQSQILLDTLEKVIQEKLSAGIKVEDYAQPCSKGVNHGAKIILPKEDVPSLLGAKSIVISLRENQPEPNRNNRYQKAQIATIYQI